ncbi:XdhC family protein [Thalassotalea agarivorans]|uniref:XdhC and CoxI family protein n=1 Tax=Thalassotalea agarivorans TaxID=349064 RepID=A0A1H9ZG37_THASX|nr:XdhC/CoxI family protein [Thalassotalea agarivorans]SES80621.1 XdhC and CoxI family protein [Thalassotalea agarivorans]
MNSENWLQWQQRFDEDKAYVLASIAATEGATYQKTGAMMLIDEQLQCVGLLSGGCLEGDIALHAEKVFGDKRKRVITYDLLNDADLLWGLGLGCEGKLDIVLQYLAPSNGHLGIAQMLSAIEQGQSGYFWQNITDDGTSNGQFVTTLPANLAAGMVTPIYPLQHILICGAGPDVKPLVEMMMVMQWRVTVVDHRKAQLASMPQGATTIHQRPELLERNTLNCYSGIVVMTHNLAHDQAYLDAAIAAKTSYIGVLGPRARKEKLLKEQPKHLHNSIYGPIGLDLGGRGPQAIALSIVSEIQQHFAGEKKIEKPWVVA